MANILTALFAPLHVQTSSIFLSSLVWDGFLMLNLRQRSLKGNLHLCNICANVTECKLKCICGVIFIWFIFLFIRTFQILTNVNAILVLNKCKLQFANHHQLFQIRSLWYGYKVELNFIKRVYFGEMCNVASHPPGGAINAKKKNLLSGTRETKLQTNI